MAHHPERYRFVVDEDALEGTNEISVHPETPDGYHQPDLGDEVVFVDQERLDDDDEPLLIESITQIEDTDNYELVLSRILPEEFPEGSQLYIKPRGLRVRIHS